MIIERFYRPLLLSVNAVADNDGLLSWQEGDDPGRPLTIDDRRMALPVDVQMSRPNPAVILFHPLSESTTRGESKVLQKLMSLIRLRLSGSLLKVMHHMTLLCADHDTNRKLSPEASVMLSCLPEADARTVEDMGKILDICLSHPDKLIKIYLKRGGEYHGKRMSRVAVVTFPLWAEFENDERSVFGVALRKKDYTGFKKLIEFILPKVDENEGYNAGSMSMTAPYLDALVQAYLKVARDLNRAGNVILKQLADPDSVLIDIDWEEEARDLAIYREDIPVMEDSMGAPVNAQGVEGTAAAVNAVTAGASALFPKKLGSAADSLLTDSRPASPAHAVHEQINHRAEQHRAPAEAGSGGSGAGGARSVTELMERRRQQEMERIAQQTGYPPAGYIQPGHPGHPQHHYVHTPAPAPAAPGEYPGFHRGVAVQPMHTGYGYNAGYGTAPGAGTYGYAQAPVDPNALAAANAYGAVAAPAPVYGYGAPAPAYGYGAPAPAYGYGTPAPGYGYPGNGYPSAV